MQNPVLGLSSGWIPNCQNPDFKSNLEKYLALAKWEKRVSLFGMGNLSSWRKWLSGW